jgi:transcriptional regulator with XRE-family HTH domain
MKNMKDILNEVAKNPLTPGELIRATRNNFEITQDEVCSITGLKRTNLSAIENGRMEMTVYYAEILGAALGLHPSTILFPNGRYEKKKEVIEIEKKAKNLFKMKKHAFGF